ncbi:uncharacterized protein LOC128232176 [Mya arenaria]|uniref:uncharacterized protein LOC128232176 n=1 Tax=Mya arenaria TaxID=6604 RepID=UPI0022E00A20|nr:uncharacterized protein LOC128232176 [Mya arenaria]XP_052801554.1 uncharacterized protein LOC128232176 [Mya arenaria]XP_052801562.1 uncharacterized protein LOC128232176 [Mya arenaria]
MTSYQNILREKEARNWVKAALALKITKDGIQDFVEDVLTCVHQDIYNTVRSSRGLKAGAICAQCFTENVLQCPTRGICTSPRNCRFHKDLTKIYAPCPNGICGGVHDEIIQHHRYTSPSWKNTNADKWYSSPWEIGKCFLPPDGYKTVSSVRDSDFNGVISVMINCYDFQKKLSFNIGAKTNLLSEVRDIGRLVHHAHDQKITDIELVDILFKLRTLLEDQTELAIRPKAQLVVEQLKQLQSDEFRINYDDERGMLKEGLRLRLMDHYRTTFGNMPISPILTEKDAKLSRFYVPPKIVEKNHRKIGSIDKVEPSQEVATFSDVFCHESQLCRNVFLVGEPGKGKSTFSAMCALEWTNQYSHQEKIIEHKACFADAEFFREFDFLFHVTLRDSGQSCNLTEMVQDQVISKIYNSHDAEYVYRILQTVLESEKCLIILDGLDEWNHPETVNCTCRAEGSFIPSQISANRATVLTTTRPWRLSQFRVKDSKIDKYLEIEGANEPEEIVKNVVTILNEENEVERDPEDFMKMIRVNGLQDLLATPIVTTQLVCLWFEGVSLTESKCNIYAGLINMLSCRHRYIREKVPEIELPSVFKNHECFRYNPLVYLALAKLAYTTLFSGGRETSVVFSSSLVNQVLAKGQIEYALKSGLLTEKKSNSLVKRTSHFSFLHKTVQEFLSALHFCLNENDYNQLLSKYTTENKQTVLGDVSQVFVFICGMKPELAVQMSSWINSSIPQTPFHSESWFYDDNDAQYDLDNEARLEHRRLIVSGLDEARANNFGDIPLTLTHFSVISGWDVRTLNYLMDANKNHVQSLTIFGCNDMVSEQELQNVFSFSGESLTNVALGYRDGQYDLSKCHKLEYLDIDGETTTHVLVDTRNIKTCMLHLVSSDVESYLLSSFEHDRKESKLQELILGDVKNTQLLCATLPSLSQLKRIHIETTDLGELQLLPPASITRIDLHAVTMTAESVRRLVMRVENIPHTVKCCMICCTVEPASEFEQIRKYVDSSPAFKRDGTHPFQFTKM